MTTHNPEARIACAPCTLPRKLGRGGRKSCCFSVPCECPPRFSMRLAASRHARASAFARSGIFCGFSSMIPYTGGRATGKEREKARQCRVPDVFAFYRARRRVRFCVASFGYFDVSDVFRAPLGQRRYDAFDEFRAPLHRMSHDVFDVYRAGVALRRR